MRNKDIPTVVRLLNRARYEVLPTPTIEEKVHASVPTEVTLTVTASPTKGIGETLATAERFSAAGYDVVPHVAARMVNGRHDLVEIVARLQEAGITKIFVPGGDATPHPAGTPTPWGCWRTLVRSAARSTTWGSPAIRRVTPPSTTTSPCSPCGTSASTRPTWSAT